MYNVRASSARHSFAQHTPQYVLAVAAEVLFAGLDSLLAEGLMCTVESKQDILHSSHSDTVQHTEQLMLKPVVVFSVAG